MPEPILPDFEGILKPRKEDECDECPSCEQDYHERCRGNCPQAVSW